MKLFTGGAAGLAATVATAVVVSMVPGADAATTGTTTRQSAVQHLSSAATSAHAAKAGSLTSTVRGTFNHGRGTVRGTFDPDRFVVKNKHTYAVGTLHTTLRRADGSLTGRSSKFVSIPVRNGHVTQGKATCQILDLVLGPLDLNLLGLKVHLNRVVLHIVAQSGAGALLGNLLCAVAGLLDGTGLLDVLRLTNVLNRILNVLRI